MVRVTAPRTQRAIPCRSSVRSAANQPLIVCPPIGHR